MEEWFLIKLHVCVVVTAHKKYPVQVASTGISTFTETKLMKLVSFQSRNADYGTAPVPFRLQGSRTIYGRVLGGFSGERGSHFILSLLFSIANQVCADERWQIVVLSAPAYQSSEKLRAVHRSPSTRLNNALSSADFDVMNRNDLAYLILSHIRTIHLRKLRISPAI